MRRVEEVRRVRAFLTALLGEAEGWKTEPLESQADAVRWEISGEAIVSSFTSTRTFPRRTEFAIIDGDGCRGVFPITMDFDDFIAEVMRVWLDERGSE